MIKQKPKPVYCFSAIQNEKLLLVEKGGHWILPGGKPKVICIKTETETETEIEIEKGQACIIRESKEELPLLVLHLDTLKYFGAFLGKAPRKGYNMCAYVYHVKVYGDITSNPDSEISDAVWTSSPETYNLSESARDAVRSLRENGHLPKL